MVIHEIKKNLLRW